MLTPFLILSILAIAASVYIKKNFGKFLSPRLPPGPVGLPILGYLPFMDVNDFGGSFTKLSKKFGAVFSMKMGTETAIVVNSYETIKTVLSNPVFNARPNTFMFNAFNNGNRGIASCSGENWKVQRKFTHKTLKTVGYGRGMEKINANLKEEVADLVRVIKQKSEGNNGQVQIGNDINVAVANCTLAMVAGERRPIDDPELIAFLTSINRGIEMASTSGILLFMPFLIKLFPERYLGVDKLRQYQRDAQTFLQKTIDEHKVNYVEGEESKDLIDAFLAESKREGAHKSFDEQQLLILCTELFGAGGEPVSVTLRWAVRFLAKYPEIQRRAQQEIENVVGKDKTVELSDRTNLPYIQALVYDLMRFADIHPIGVLHSPTEDAVVDGHDIPEGSFMFFNFHNVHRDTKFWSHPDRLHPEHWLDAEGKFTGANRQGFLSFGVGKRNCPGQDMAVLQLFSFVSNLVQNFDFSFVAGDCGEMERSQGCVISPKPYDIQVRARF
jgi:cytochrome P450